MLFSAPTLPESAYIGKSPEAVLHLALHAAGVAPGEHVLVPCLATSELAGALYRAEALPILIDVRADNWLLDLDLLEQFLMGHTLLNEEDVLVLRRNGAPVRALVAVHLNGNPCDLDRLRFIARRFHLVLIEDACEATGAFYAQRPVGIFGEMGVLCLDGHPSSPDDKGALLLGGGQEILQNLQGHPLMGQYPEEFHRAHLSVAHLPLLQEAPGKRERLSGILERWFSSVPREQWQSVLPQAEPFCNSISFACERSAALREAFARAGIGTTSFTPPLNRLPAFRACTYIRIHDYAQQLFDQCIRIPEALEKSEAEWETISETLRTYFNPA
ncbi:MAG: DegT/DnrJ/EryC1/StrS family aminotransferase [Saprospiraceae bacterium]|jgi:dTDP-4-amino-4,6-dideoxygalactose transaminase